MLELDALVRSVQVNSDSAYSFLLGAGSSMTSGIPSASDCIWQWKHSIFVTNNPALEALVGEPSLPAVRQRIDRWLSANGLWPPEDEDDYSYYIEKYLKIPDDLTCPRLWVCLSVARRIFLPHPKCGKILRMSYS